MLLEYRLCIHTEEGPVTLRMEVWYLDLKPNTKSSCRQVWWFGQSGSSLDWSGAKSRSRLVNWFQSLWLKLFCCKFGSGINCAAINSRRSFRSYKPEQTGSLNYSEISANRTGPNELVKNNNLFNNGKSHMINKTMHWLLWDVSSDWDVVVFAIRSARSNNNPLLFHAYTRTSYGWDTIR